MNQAIRRSIRTAALLAAGLLPACAPGALPDPAGPRAAPPGAAPGTCWDKTESPAVVQTVTEKVLIAPADMTPEGIIRQPARYRTENRQEIITPRRESWYQILCAAEVTPDFVASLQRALAARGFYAGPVTGAFDTGTQAALARFDPAQGAAAGTIRMETARRLGLAVSATPAG